jgi:hypothetical protein
LLGREGRLALCAKRMGITMPEAAMRERLSRLHLRG